MRLFFCVWLLFTVGVQSQNTTDFSKEVASISKKYEKIWDASRETIVFTGSSSIRLWPNIQKYFPEHQIVNTGFGGSETKDLLDYSEVLILKYKPQKVFIYEGDNDIAEKKRLKEILNSFAGIIAKIKTNDTSTKIILISLKPSISRWHLKRKYKRLNRKLQNICKKDEALEFANIWDVMLEKRQLKKELFVEDGLHMTAEGYRLWYSVIKEFVD
jgi:lysophospholipase L1-like esterase